MTKEEIAKRFCKFELCTHRNGEGMCCLYNQDNCIFHRLEKENAELKEENKILRIHQTNAVLNGLEMKVLKDSHRDRANKLQDQLTKAKEIIKDLLSCLYSVEYDRVSDLEEAEKFLKEIEK